MAKRSGGFKVGRGGGYNAKVRAIKWLKANAAKPVTKKPTENQPSK